MKFDLISLQLEEQFVVRMNASTGLCHDSVKQGEALTACVQSPSLLLCSCGAFSALFISLVCSLQSSFVSLPSALLLRGYQQWSLSCHEDHRGWNESWHKILVTTSPGKTALASYFRTHKVVCMCFRAISGSGPAYLSELLHVYTLSRKLRSTSDTRMLEIQQYKRKTYGFRIFSCFGPHI